MEGFKLHLHDLHLLLEEPPDMTRALLKSDYFDGNNTDILHLKGIFECMEDPKILGKWFQCSKVRSSPFLKHIAVQQYRDNSHFLHARLS